MGSWSYNLQSHQSFSQGATNWPWMGNNQVDRQQIGLLKSLGNDKATDPSTLFWWTSWSGWTHENQGAWSLDLEKTLLYPGKQRKFRPFKKPSKAPKELNETDSGQMSVPKSDTFGIAVRYCNHQLTGSSVPLGVLLAAWSSSSSRLARCHWWVWMASPTFFLGTRKMPHMKEIMGRILKNGEYP